MDLITKLLLSILELSLKLLDKLLNLSSLFLVIPKPLAFNFL